MNNDFEVRGKETAIFIKNKEGKEFETIVSTTDLEKVRDFIGLWTAVWSKSNNSYYVHGHGGLVNDEKKFHSLHRWIMDEPLYFVIDHVNHDTLNNSYMNLRIVSQSVNLLNRKNVGVTKYKDRWKAQFVFGGKRHRLGYFDTEEEARAVLEEAKAEFIAEEQSWNEAENEHRYFANQVKECDVFNY